MWNSLKFIRILNPKPWAITCLSNELWWAGKTVTCRTTRGCTNFNQFWIVFAMHATNDWAFVICKVARMLETGQMPGCSLQKPDLESLHLFSCGRLAICAQSQSSAWNRLPNLALYCTEMFITRFMQEHILDACSTNTKKFTLAKAALQPESLVIQNDVPCIGQKQPHAKTIKNCTKLGIHRQH